MVVPFFKMGYSSGEPYVISRIRNCLVEALNKKVLLPKYIIVVPERDITDSLNLCDGKEEVMIGKALDTLMCEMSCLILDRKEFLPNQSKRLHYPQVIWVQPPSHKNFEDNNLRSIFNNCLERTLLRFQDVCYLKLKDRWDPRREELYRFRKYTADGIGAYWEAIDAAFKYWDCKGNKIQSPSLSRIDNWSGRNDRYHWSRISRGNFNRNNDNRMDTFRFRLPAPPPVRENQD